MVDVTHTPGIFDLPLTTGQIFMGANLFILTPQKQ